MSRAHRIRDLKEKIGFVQQDIEALGPEPYLTARRAILLDELKALESERPIDSGFTYRGYTYHAEFDVESDRDKCSVWHSVTTPKGETIDVELNHWDGLTTPRPSEFKGWVEARIQKGIDDENAD